MILIHVNKTTPRIEYIFEVVFKNILKVDFSITTDATAFKNCTSVKFSYGNQPLGNEVFFKAHQILFQQGIERQILEEIVPGDEPVFFRVSDGALSFDPFASSFYLITRYEEYLHHSKDQYGRFSSHDSIASKGGFLERPIINVWALQIRRILQEKYKEYVFPTLQYSYTPTIDIDNAYSFKNKGLLRIFLSFILLLLLLDFKKIVNKVKVHLGLKKDPFDTYEKQMMLHKKYDVKPLYFILLGKYGKYDKNISYYNKTFRSLIKRLDEHGEVAIHPSFNSNKNIKIVSQEKSRLEKILNRDVVKSRQHYIMLHLPTTYRNLIECGIQEDYSMGYPDNIGFRAGVATPFYFYDLEREHKTNLKIYPFVAMDTTLKKYLKIRSKDAVVFIKPIVEECKSVGGQFIFIFHNESMSGEGIWKNWSHVYESFLETIK